MHNPALRQYPRTKPANVIPNQQGGFILEWLEESGRMMYRDESADSEAPDDDAEISELMAGDDGYLEEDDDDDLALDD